MPNLVGIGNSQVPTNAMLGGLAYQDSVSDIDIEKIKAKTNDTAVDVFVYDTSKDSDGGAWRHRTQNTSWYNESASATRGARKEFPTVAVIVVENNGTYEPVITIYDGDDPNLPMWMVFKTRNASGGSDQTTAVNYYAAGPYPIRKVVMLNGVMVDCQYRSSGHVANIVKGVTRYNFINDSSTMITDEGDFRRNGNLGDERNTEKSYIKISTNEIVHTQCNDVAITVLLGAPIDETTGLPVPTIAVATDGGTNIINDDGTVTQGYQTIATENVDLHPDGFMTDGISGAVNDSFSLYKIGTTTRVAAYGHREGVHPIGTFLNEGTGKCLFEGKSNKIAIAQTLGLLRIEEDLSNYTSGLHNRTTSSFNTGWMPGNIKGAFLSDTDATDVTGTELVSNGTFDSNTNNWTVLNSSSLSVSSNELLISYGSATSAGAYQDISVEAGKTYVWTYNGRSSNSGQLIKPQLVSQSGAIFVTSATSITNGTLASNNGTVIQIRSSANHNVNQVYSTTFKVSSSGTVRIELYANYNASAYFDNVSVRVAVSDRSEHKDGLQVFGTIQKDPVATGAELVAYHGLNGSNYLRQPYNSNLNFGTGDFSVIVWVKKNTLSTNHYIFDRATTFPSFGGSSGRAYFIINSNGYHRYKLAGGSEQSGNQVKMPTGVFTQIGFVRRSGAMEFYTNGVLVQTITGGNASASFDGGVTTQTMTVNRYANGFAYDYTFDRMALLRIAGTAPSASQMKKIYNDEKCLFHENAKCALYGTSDAVTALAFDDKNDILHVGTSAGRSEFQGLNRINNTTTAVTTAISASNGLVAEQ